jgi:hypothetical protein
MTCCKDAGKGCMMRSFSGKIMFVVLFATLMLGAASSLQATPVSYDLTVDHCSGGCGPAGTVFGTVSLVENGTGVDVTVHLNSGFAYAKTGAVDMQAFKFNGTGIVLGDITIDAHSPALTKNTGSFNGNGTGAFAFGISCSSCGGGMSDAFTNDIVFHVANAEISDLTGANANGFVFAADVGDIASGKAGPIGTQTPETTITVVSASEPASIIMLGLGILGVGLVARKKNANV